MKKILWLAAILAAAVLISGMFRSSDVAKLQPVEVLRVRREGSGIRVETDTGETGQGPTLADAFADLKAGTAGDIFLDTVEFVLVDTEEMAGELMAFLRPACRVCLERGEAELEKAADFLDIHRPEVTLMDCRGQPPRLPILRTQEGRMQLVS